MLLYKDAFRFSLALIVFSMTATIAAAQSGPVIAHMGTSVQSPQPVGTAVVITASAQDPYSGPATFKFELQRPGSQSFTLLQDYSVGARFTWVPTTTDGHYVIRVTARNYLAGQYSAPVTKPFILSTRVAGSVPLVTATSMPLVALFSAPACPIGSFMNVTFQPSPSGIATNTDFRPCLATSMNFLIGGMRESSTYLMNFQIQTNGVTTPDTNTLPFTTGTIPASVKIPRHSLPVPASAATSQSEQVVLAGICAGSIPFATDLAGNVIWYFNQPNVFQVTRPVTGGTILMLFIGEGTGTGYWGKNTKQQILEEVDLAGNVVREVTADRVSEQIPAADLPVGLDRFSHEARKLPNGQYLVLSETQQIFPPGTQGSANALDIIGPVILILDENFQLVWYWNVFQHTGSAPTQLDPNRAPTLNETCYIEANGQTSNGCPPKLLSSPASEWQHVNALQLLSDGSILASARDQDWIYKIDYANGVGTGNILWRMGLDGDFTFVGTTDLYPWFSGQHDPEFQQNGMSTLTVFDDGDTRITNDGGVGDSRGQVLNVDENSMTVSFIVNADLGVFSYALGSAQSLANGDYFFDAGEITPKNNYTQLIETDPSGAQTYNEQIQYTTYRAFRMKDFYNVPQT